MAQFRPSPTVTIGVLGLGDIGQGVGKMLRGAGYKVLGFKRRVSPEQELELAHCADRVTPDLDEVLSQSDYLVNVLPSTSSTRYLLNEKNLELCRERKPVFINIGRGDVVPEKTIIHALDDPEQCWMYSRRSHFQAIVRCGRTPPSCSLPTSLGIRSQKIRPAFSSTTSITIYVASRCCTKWIGQQDIDLSTFSRFWRSQIE
ncbi:hypothetical protein PI125_g3501 [Phytophthora idaei]|nr:hypothetical protein PI125_g3501 [Phytophthora idaei]